MRNEIGGYLEGVSGSYCGVSGKYHIQKKEVRLVYWERGILDKIQLSLIFG